MKLDEFESRLLAVARENPPGDSVPYAFEKRIMASLMAAGRGDPATWWNRALWRAAVPCLLVMLSVSLWTVLADNSNRGADNLGTQLEDAILAPVYAAIDQTW